MRGAPTARFACIPQRSRDRDIAIFEHRRYDFPPLVVYEERRETSETSDLPDPPAAFGCACCRDARTRVGVGRGGGQRPWAAEGPPRVHGLAPRPGGAGGPERPHSQAHSRHSRGDRSSQGFARSRGSREARPADRDGKLRREDERLPHRAERGPGRSRGARLRQGQRRSTRPDGQRRRGARAEPRLRRHPRHPPSELRAEGERCHGLRQRRQGQRRQGRPHHQRDRLARRLARGRARRDTGISAAQAVLAAKQNVGAGAARPVTTSADELSTRFASGDVAQLVYFKTLDGAYARVQDAARRRRLPGRRRRRLGEDPLPGQHPRQRQRPRLGQPARGRSLGRHAALVRRQRPGRLVGLRRVRPHHPHGRRPLSSNNVLGVQRREREQRRQPQRTDPERRYGNFNYAFTPFTNTTNSPCSAAYPCSWNSHFPDGAFSWDTNRKQNGTQVYFFVNTFHDHLLAAPIGFTEAAGNFQLVNSTGQGEDGDPVHRRGRRRREHAALHRRRPHRDARRQPHRQRELQHAARRRSRRGRRCTCSTGRSRPTRSAR